MHNPENTNLDTGRPSPTANPLCWKCGATVSGYSCFNCGAQPSISKALKQIREERIAAQQSVISDREIMEAL